MSYKKSSFSNAGEYKSQLLPLWPNFAPLCFTKNFFFVFTKKENFCLERIKFNANEKNRLNVELNTAKDNYKMMLENTNYKIER